MSGKVRAMRRWEAGDIPVTGPAEVAIEMMLDARTWFKGSRYNG